MVAVVVTAGAGAAVVMAAVPARAASGFGSITTDLTVPVTIGPATTTTTTVDTSSGPLAPVAGVVDHTVQTVTSVVGTLTTTVTTIATGPLPLPDPSSPVPTPTTVPDLVPTVPAVPAGQVPPAPSGSAPAALPAPTGSGPADRGSPGSTPPRLGIGAAAGFGEPHLHEAGIARPDGRPRLLSVAPATTGVSGAIGARRFRGAARAAARAMTLPGALGALVAVFLLVQNRIDARDPRLAVAPIEADDDTVGFA